MIDREISLKNHTKNDQAFNKEYELYGIVHHHGSIQSGHYTSDVRIKSG
jgi:ubiquitin C-terminal hydrolase